MGYRTTNTPAKYQCIFNIMVPLLLTILFMSAPTNADGDKYYGAFVGNFEDRFHGIKGEVNVVRLFIVRYATNNKIKCQYDEIAQLNQL